MAKDFLPKVITWFRLDEHVRRLKEFIDSLITRDIMGTNQDDLINFNGNDFLFEIRVYN